MAEEVKTVDGRATGGTTEDLGGMPNTQYADHTMLHDASTVGTYIYYLETEVLQFCLEKSEVGRYIVRRVSFAASGMLGVGKSRHTRYHGHLGLGVEVESKCKDKPTHDHCCS